MTQSPWTASNTGPRTLGKSNTGTRTLSNTKRMYCIVNKTIPSHATASSGPHSPFGDAVRISTPPSTTSSVCSHCAVHFPSRVTAVHPSRHITSSVLPMVNMGSMVKVWPEMKKKVSVGRGVFE